MEEPKCPECEKLAQISAQSQKLGFFLEWLFNNKGILCKWQDKTFYEDEDFWEEEGYYPIRENIEQILADYFKIDMDKVNEERNGLLKWIRENKEGQ